MAGKSKLYTMLGTPSGVTQLSNGILHLHTEHFQPKNNYRDLFNYHTYSLDDCQGESNELGKREME